MRNSGVRFVCPKVKAGLLLATLRRAPLYWAAIWALKARQFSGYEYRVWNLKINKQGMTGELLIHLRDN